MPPHLLRPRLGSSASAEFLVHGGGGGAYGVAAHACPRRFTSVHSVSSPRDSADQRSWPAWRRPGSGRRPSHTHRILEGGLTHYVDGIARSERAPAPGADLGDHGRGHDRRDSASRRRRASSSWSGASMRTGPRTRTGSPGSPPCSRPLGWAWWRSSPSTRPPSSASSSVPRAARRPKRNGGLRR